MDTCSILLKRLDKLLACFFLLNHLCTVMAAIQVLVTLGYVFFLMCVVSSAVVVFA